jgi:hypothetical protein
MIRDPLRETVVHLNHIRGRLRRKTARQSARIPAANPKMIVRGLGDKEISPSNELTTSTTANIKGKIKAAKEKGQIGSRKPRINLVVRVILLATPDTLYL